MNLKSYSRKHLRAPIQTYFLFEDDHYVYKAKLVNISEGGVLIECLPHLPIINIIALLIDIPMIPLLDLSTFNINIMNEDRMKNLERKIFRVRLKTIRRNTDETKIDQMFIKIGGQFMTPRENMVLGIKQYTLHYAQNIANFIKMIEDQDLSDAHRVDKIRLFAKILGYDDQEKLTLLHQKVLHDYRSLVPYGR